MLILSDNKLDGRIMRLQQTEFGDVFLKNASSAFSIDGDEQLK